MTLFTKGLVEHLCSLNRMLGSSGNLESASYLRNQLQSLGLQTTELRMGPKRSLSSFVAGRRVLLVLVTGLATGLAVLLGMPPSLWIMIPSWAVLALYHQLRGEYVLNRGLAPDAVVGRYASDTPAEFVVVAHFDAPPVFRFTELSFAGAFLAAGAWTIGSRALGAVFHFNYQYVMALQALWLLQCVGVSPGGNDNSSGVASAMELAEQLRDMRKPFVVALTNGEEQGLLGARALAEAVKSGAIAVSNDAMIICLDCTGSGTVLAVDCRTSSTSLSDSLTSRAGAMATEHGLLLKTTQLPSDHLALTGIGKATIGLSMMDKDTGVVAQFIRHPYGFASPGFSGIHQRSDKASSVDLRTVHCCAMVAKELLAVDTRQ